MTLLSNDSKAGGLSWNMAAPAPTQQQPKIFNINDK